MSISQHHNAGESQPYSAMAFLENPGNKLVTLLFHLHHERPPGMGQSALERAQSLDLLIEKCEVDRTVPDSKKGSLRLELVPTNPIHSVEFQLC